MSIETSGRRYRQVLAGFWIMGSLALLLSEADILQYLGIGLLTAAILSLIILPKDNVLPFRKRPH